MAFQRRSWFAERCGWLVMAIVLIAAALGLFAGSGPLNSATTADSRSTLRVEYQRMQRFNAPTTIKLTVSSSAITPDGFEIDIYGSFFEALKLTAIRPEPAQAAALADRMRLRFAAPAGQDATIYFYASPDSIGLARLNLGLGGDEPLHIAMFIYP